MSHLRMALLGTLFTVALLVAAKGVATYVWPTHQEMAPEVTAKCFAQMVPDAPPVVLIVNYEGDGKTQLPPQIFDLQKVPFGKPVVIGGLQIVTGWGDWYYGVYAPIFGFGHGEWSKLTPGVYLLRGLPAKVENGYFVRDVGKPMYYRVFVVPYCK